MTGFTTHKEEVDVPKWAEEYDLGDEIAFYNPKTDKIETDRVIGWSLLQEYENQPVIPAPDSIGSSDKIAMTEEYLHRKNDIK
ncbi:MAG: hypothetical protein ABEH81_01225 [Halopenitus sp.]